MQRFLLLRTVRTLGWRIGPVAIIVLCLVGDRSGLAEPGPESEPRSEERVTIPMEDCRAFRPAEVDSLLDVFVIGFTGAPPAEPLVKKGDLKLDDEVFTFYLPEADRYTVENTGAEGRLEDTSTAISIDDNGDGKLAAAEKWYTSRPVRVGDRMFEVVEIAEDGSRIELVASSGPLRGALPGRKCPVFEFQDDSGRKLSNKDFDGRALVLDIWSMT